MGSFNDSFAGTQQIIDGVPNPIFVKNRDHRVVLLNDSACLLFGHSRETMLAKSDHDLFPPAEVRIFHRADDLAFETGEASENEESLTDGTGQVRHVITRKRVARIGGEDYLIASLTDVSMLRQTQAHNRYLAFHDPLTGLGNRAMLAERIDQALARRRHGCALLYIDLDRFKDVNDTHGHPAGDELICEFASRLSDIVRSSDTVVRLGGDEFAVLLADTSQDPNADEMSRRVLIAAARSFELSAAQVRVGASIGVVITGMDEVDGTELQRRADVALYQAKSEGRGCFRIFSQDLDKRITHRHRLTADLRDALDTGTGLRLVYQPLVEIGTGEVVAFEALARWDHPVLGPVPPAEFIAVAEASGLIIELGEWVLSTACQAARWWRPPLRLSVNISPIQFVSGDLAQSISRTMADNGFDTGRLDLEITESVLTQDPGAALALLDDIRATGVKIVLDDFGTGYSSLSYFRQFPFDKIKIDRSFIADMLDNKRALSIVQAVISLGNGLDVEVVAEGVETQAQLDALAGLGCSQAQGYLLGQPMPIESFVGTALEEI